MSDWRNRAVPVTGTWKDRAIPLQPVTPEVSQLESGIRGAAQGATLGFADEATGALEALKDELTGSAADKSLGDLYRQHRDESRAAYDAAQKANPKTFLAGQVGGGIATAFVPGLNIAKGATLAGRTAMAAGLGGATALGTSKADITQGDLANAARDTAKGAALGGVLQPVFEKVAQPLIEGAAGKVNDVANYILKKGNRAILGVPEEASAHYLTNAPAVNTQRPFESVYDDVLDKVNARKAAYEAAKEGVGNAREAFKDLASNTRLGMNQDRLDAALAAQEAGQDLRNAYTQTIEGLKNGPKPIDLKDDVVNAVSALRQRALEAEDKASQILEDQGVQLPVNEVLNKLKQIKSQYGIGPEKDVFTGANKEAANEIDSIYGDLLNFRGDTNEFRKLPGMEDVPEELLQQGGNTHIPAADARKLLKSINKRINFLDTSGGFMGMGSQSLDQFRSFLRNRLGEASPEFDAEMKENVAPLFRLLNDADYHFGKDSRALTALNNIASPTSSYKREILERLGDETGLDFRTPVAQYEQLQNLLKSPTALAGIKENLPEATDQLRAQAQAQTLRRPSFQNSFLEDTLSSSPEAETLKSAEQSLSNAESSFAPYKGMSEGTIQNTLKAAQRGNSINKERVLTQLGQETGNDYLGELKNLYTKEAFNRDTTNGSRRVMLGTALGTGIGAVTGHPWLGSSVGAGIGAFIDKYGGQLAKNLLDSKIWTAKGLNYLANSKYGDVIAKAALRGNQSLATVDYLLKQTDPEYRKAVSDE